MSIDPAAAADHERAAGALGDQAAANQAETMGGMSGLADLLTEVVATNRAIATQIERADRRAEKSDRQAAVEAKKAADARRKLFVSNVILVAVVVISGASLGYADHTLYQVQRQSNRTQEQVQSCVQSSGTCYKRNAQSNQGNLSSILDAGQSRIAIAREDKTALQACTYSYSNLAGLSEKERYEKLDACVKRVEAQLPQPSPSPYATPSN